MDIPRFLSLVEDIIKNNISDLHFGTNEYPYIRNGVGDMSPVQAFGILTEADISMICAHLLGRIFTERTLDISFEHSGTRFRVNISRTIHGVTLAFRMIPSTIPEAEAIGFPNHLLDLTLAEK